MNTLAYYGTELIMTVKSFRVHAARRDKKPDHPKMINRVPLMRNANLAWSSAFFNCN